MAKAVQVQVLSRAPIYPSGLRQAIRRSRLHINLQEPVVRLGRLSGIAAFLIFASHCLAESNIGSVRDPSGLEFVQIPTGSFQMGSEAGNWDEKPVHTVTITRSFWISKTEVSTTQYKRFDPDHGERAGLIASAATGTGAVVFVSWNDAEAYCEWLTEKQGGSYRLPTEAEWEYAQRTHAEALSAASASNEDWCSDWYGPYPTGAQTNATGYAEGDLKVTRGGSWRAIDGRPDPAARLADVPTDRNRVVSFRLVMGEPPTGKPLVERPTRRWGRDVGTNDCDWVARVDMTKPYFAEPIPFVVMAAGQTGPLFSHHNHDPGLAWCRNGDLLAIWYSTTDEKSRDLVVAGSRLRRGSNSWDEADLFWDVPGRNDHAPALWQDGKGTLYHFNGLAVEGGWAELALVLRTSTDNGATWSHPRIIRPKHGLHNMPIPSPFRTRDGTIYLPCDAVTGGEGGSVLNFSRDDGQTWFDSGEGQANPDFKHGGPGAWIAGIHAGVDEWNDGSLVAIGRGNSINGHMPMSVSTNGGKNWIYSAIPFPPISSGQRAVLRRLREGPLLLVSFTPGSTFRDARGQDFEGHGLFAALSFDGGKTWPRMKLLVDGRHRTLDGRGSTHEFTMDATHGEPKGYLTAVQTPDAIIHLISSGIYYHFNLAWLNKPN